MSLPQINNAIPQKIHEFSEKLLFIAQVLKCKSKHHTSICDKLADSKSELMLVTTKTNVTYSVAIIKLKGVKCRAFLDTGSGSLYISESFIDLLKINPVKKE